MRLDKKKPFSNPSIGFLRIVWEMRWLKIVIVYVYDVCKCVLAWFMPETIEMKIKKQ